MSNHLKKLNFQTVFLINQDLHSFCSDNIVKIEDTVNVIRNAVLRILTFFNSYGQGLVERSEPLGIPVNCSRAAVNLEWGVKFFNGSSPSDRIFDGVQFKEFKLKEFEDFEIELESKLNRPFAGVGRNHSDRQSSTEYGLDMFENLQTALERLMYDFPWDRPDMTSPVRLSRVRSSFVQSGKRHCNKEALNERHNFVFIVADCPHSMDDLVHMAGCDQNPSSVLRSILLQRMFHEFSEIRRLRLFWLDVNTKACSDLSGLRLMNDALELVNGRVISVGAILNMGVLNCLHIHSLLHHSNEVSRVGEEYMEENSHHLSDVAADCNMPKSLLLPYSNSLNYYMRPVSEDKQCSRVLLYFDCDVGCQVILQPLIKASSSSFFRNFTSSSTNIDFKNSKAKIKIHSTSSPSCDIHLDFKSEKKSICETASVVSSSSLMSDNDINYSQGSAFTVVATLSDDPLLLASYQSENIYLVTEAQDIDNSSKCLNFKDILLQLALNGQLLILQNSSASSVNLPSSSFGFLRPLTTISATLTFCHHTKDPALDLLLSHSTSHQEGIASSNTTRLLNIQKILNQLIPIDFKSDKSSDHLQRPFNTIATSNFNPIILENWFSAPEVLHKSNDSLISMICEGDESETDIERDLLYQLEDRYSKHCRGFFEDISSTKNQHSKSSHSILAPLPVFNSQLNETFSSQRDAFHDRGTRCSVRISACKTPSKETSQKILPKKLHSKTPRKTSSKTPKKTPSKCRKKTTPRKTSFKSPSRRSSKKNLKKEKVSSDKKSFSGGNCVRMHIKDKQLKEIKRHSSTSAPSRTDIILQRSRDALAKSLQDEESLKESRLDKKMASSRNGKVEQTVEQVTTTGWQDLNNVNELLAHLQIMYCKVAEGEGSPVIGAKSILNSALQFFKNQSDETALTSACDLIHKHICTSSSKVIEKYKGRNDLTSVESKCREYQIQIYLQFELNTESCREDFIDKTARQVSSMLSSLAIVKGVNFLSSFLNDLLDSYLDSSSSLLLNVYENLGRPVPPLLQHLLSPEPDDEDHSLAPLSSLPSIHSTSSAPSNSNGNVKAKRQSFYRHPTFNLLPTKQIELIMQPNKSKNSLPYRRSARIASASKLNTTQPTTSKFTVQD